MSMYLGDFAADATIPIYFTTNDGNGGAVAPSSAFENADVKIFKDGSATEKLTQNGVVMTSPFNTTTGLHLLTIDTNIDTGDVGFWTTGSDYTAVLDPDETVDGETVVAVIATFSIENRFMRGTDSAALASVCTEGRLVELDAANLPADIDAILVDTVALTGVNAEIVDATDIPATATLLQQMTLIYMWVRNNSQSTSSERRILNDNGDEVLAATVSDNGSLYTQGQLGD